jgi:hypothetical protein
MQKSQYLGMSADKALLEVEGVDSQKIPVGVRGVAIFKVGDDEHSITNAGVRFLEAQQGQMHDLVREVFHGHLRSIIGSMSVEDLIANRNELAQATRDASADEMQKLGLGRSTRCRSRRSSTRPATSARSASRARPRSRCRRASRRPPPTARRPSASRRPRR